MAMLEPIRRAVAKRIRFIASPLGLPQAIVLAVRRVEKVARFSPRFKIASDLW